MNHSKQIADRARAEIRQLHDGIDRFVARLAAEHKFEKTDAAGPLSYTDAQVAPLYAEKLRYLYARLYEVIYPDLEAANGEVLPIDSSIPPGAQSWEYDMIDAGASMDWIDDEGHVAPSAFVRSAGKFSGKFAEFGGGYATNLFDDERATMAGMNLDPHKQNAVKRAHDEFVQWRWLFGSPEKDGMLGLCTHPALPMATAALNAGATSRLPANKSNDEILGDFVTVIDGVPAQSREAHFTAEVYMPPTLHRLMRSRFLENTATGMVTLWDRLISLFSGDAAGQKKVTFKLANWTMGSRRINPKTGTDTSGIAGDFLLALPPRNLDELCFTRPRALTARPPENKGFSVEHLYHAKIGGTKMVRPLSCSMLQFGTT